MQKKNPFFTFAAARSQIRNDSPQSVESPKLTPSPPSNVPPNIHHVIIYLSINNRNYYSNLTNVGLDQHKNRQITVEQLIFIHRPQIIRPPKQVTQLLPNHRCQYRSRAILRIPAIRSQSTYTQGQHPM